MRKLREQRLRKLIREEIQLLNEVGWYPDEQFGGNGSPFGGYLSEVIVNSFGRDKDYEVWFQMHGNTEGTPFTIPNSEKVNKFHNDDYKMYYKWQKELERKVKQKFRKDTLKTRKEIEKLVVNEFEKLKQTHKL